MRPAARLHRFTDGYTPSRPRKNRNFQHEKEKVMTSTTIKVDGMSCSGCSSQVGRLLSELPGVTKADVELASGLAQVEFDAGKVDHEALLTVIRDAGFGARISAAGIPG
jgi:copper chaperone CopZ